MPNPIKYSTGSESLALKKGNFYIGTGDVGKGPTSTTGYYDGITPPSGGYTIYLNKATGGPSIYTCSNDSELISLTNGIAGTSYTTANECLTYFAGQTDKLCVNNNYEPIITDGLVLNLDAGFIPSYPKNGTNWYDNSSNAITSVLYNSTGFDSSNNGSLVFDGTDDTVRGTFNLPFNTANFTCEAWVNPSNYSGERCIFGKPSSGPEGSTRANIHWRLIGNNTTGCVIRWGFYSSDIDTTQVVVPFNTWTQVVMSYDYNGGSSSGKIYTNGVSRTTTLPFVGNLGPYVGSNGATNYIGGWTPSSQLFLGKIATFRMWNRQLTDAEVLQNYNAQKGRFGL